MVGWTERERLLSEDGSESNTSLSVDCIKGQRACRLRIHLDQKELVNVLVTAQELRALTREVSPAVIRYARELTLGFDVRSEMFVFHFNIGAARVTRFLDSGRFEAMIDNVVYRDATA